MTHRYRIDKFICGVHGGQKHYWHISVMRYIICNMYETTKASDIGRTAYNIRHTYMYNQTVNARKEQRNETK